VKKADFSQGPFRWLTVASSEEPDGVELQLALNDNPAARAYQQAMFEQNQPAMMFRNRAHGGLNVVYRRPDGNIGWIDPGAAR
jgi:hypothetical protein